ncbi:MAG: HDOD domain-containing protein [Gammaproteobacteria bacterium]
MHGHSINLSSLPGSNEVVGDIRKYFQRDEIDLRDITDLARQDPVVLANILFLVNESFLRRNSPVVNTLSAAINLIGLEPLKNRLLSIKSLNEIDINPKSAIVFELLKSRTYMTSCLTQFWAEYLGQTSAEEIFCASMFTGVKDMSACLASDGLTRQSLEVDSIEAIQALYSFKQDDIGLLPDSIQQVHENSSISERLKLSILVYDLVSCFELGFSTSAFRNALQKTCDFIGISMHRAGYDFSQQVVEIDRNASHQVFHHSHFLLTSNIEAIEPLATF